MGTVDADAIDGGPNNDTVYGYAGNDMLWGADGADTLGGYEGEDIMIGGNGSDLMNGGNGADKLYGNLGDDHIHAGYGADRALGGAGNDLVIGHRGEDDVQGNVGDDTITGNMLYNALIQDYDAEDLRDVSLVGELSEIARFGPVAMRDDLVADMVDGGSGNDILYLGEFDEGTGGTGADQFIIQNSACINGVTTITDYDPAEDRIILEYPGTVSQPATVTDDGSGNAQIRVSGEVVVIVTGAAATLSTSDVSASPQGT